MFLCESCMDTRGDAPDYLARLLSRGPCEGCGEVRECYGVPPPTTTNVDTSQEIITHEAHNRPVSDPKSPDDPCILEDRLRSLGADCVCQAGGLVEIEVAEFQEWADVVRDELREIAALLGGETIADRAEEVD